MSKGNDSEEAMRFTVGWREAARRQAAELRRDPRWEFARLPPSFALAHAAAELFQSGVLEEASRRRVGGLMVKYANAFLRVAAERAALDGDKNSLAAITEWGMRERARGQQQLHGETRPFVGDAVEKALARIDDDEEE